MGGTAAVAPQFEIEPPDKSGQQFEIEPPDEQKPQGGKFSRFLTRATGIDVADIAAHPSEYNPFSKDYWSKAKREGAQPMQMPTARQLIPFGQTAQDISDKKWPEVAGDLAPGVVMGATTLAGMGSDLEVPGPGTNRVPLWKRAGVEAGHPEPNIEVTHPPEPVGPRLRSWPKPAAEAPAQPPVESESDIEQARRRPLPAPYSLGPGQVPADVVGQPPTDVLAGNQGVIVRPQKQLPAARLNRPLTADAIDDAGISQEMKAELERDGRNAYRDDRRDWNDRNSPAVPKWKQVAQIRAQLAAEAVMKEAEAAQSIPARLTKTKAPRSEQASSRLGPSQAATPDEELLPKLEESLRQAKAKKAQPKEAKK